MSSQRGTSSATIAPREQLLAGLPVKERTIDLAGISTAVLEGGIGPPLVLLHGPLGNALHWIGVIPSLIGRHRVVAPDLPGHGASRASDEALDFKTLLAWLRELIEATCEVPPAVVGHLAGGAIAARLVAEEPARVSQLILVHSFGLGAAELASDFAAAVSEFLAAPTPVAHEKVWRHCAFDLDGLRERMGERWSAFAASNIEGARARTMGATFASLMEHFGSAIPPGILARIAVPTTLIWGRHDPTMPLAIAEAASARYHWPLHIIEEANDDPPVEQPDALARVLRAVLGAA
ncbi:MAG: alpha/beta fold hydrolase [Opitutaceae bacterium]